MDHIADFNRDGYLIIPNALDDKTCSQLRALIDKLDNEKMKAQHRKENRHILHKAVFEDAPELCLDVFKNKKVYPIVKQLIGMCGSNRINDWSLTHI